MRRFPDFLDSQGHSISVSDGLFLAAGPSAVVTATKE